MIPQCKQNLIKKVKYNSGEITINPNNRTYKSINTAVPEGYMLLTYNISGNGYIADVVNTIIDSNSTRVVIDAYNFTSTQQQETVYVDGIYIKNKKMKEV